MTSKVIAIPESVQRALGEDTARDLVDVMNQVAATISSTKVDRSEYDAHYRLIAAQFKTHEQLEDERFRSFRAELKADIKAEARGALLTGLAWVAVLIVSLFGALYSIIK